MKVTDQVRLRLKGVMARVRIRVGVKTGVRTIRIFLSLFKCSLYPEPHPYLCFL